LRAGTASTRRRPDDELLRAVALDYDDLQPGSARLCGAPIRCGRPRVCSVAPDGQYDYFRQKGKNARPRREFMVTTATLGAVTLVGVPYGDM
jgi:hypothetical protein